jgi:hypothetical protein
VAQGRQSYAETVQVQSSVHHLTGKLGERPRGILVARATDHIVSRKIVAEAITDERTKQAATAVGRVRKTPGCFRSDRTAECTACMRKKPTPYSS